MSTTYKRKTKIGLSAMRTYTVNWQHISDGTRGTIELEYPNEEALLRDINKFNASPSPDHSKWKYWY